MFQTFLESTKHSFFSLLRNKMRSFLTMLGIVIGVSAVIIIMSVGAGAQSFILSNLKSLGTNLVGVIPGHSEEEGFSAMMGYSVRTLKYEDVLALRNKKRVPNLVAVTGYSKGSGTVVWESNSYDTNLNGVMASYPDVEGGIVEKGRFLNEEEEKNFSRVAVLGSVVKKELFGESDAIGKKIKVKDQSFEVIGIMEERGTIAMQDYDDQIFLPIKTTQKLLGVNHIGLIRGKVDYEQNINKTIEDIESTLREQHDIRDTSGVNDDFTVRSAEQMLEIIKTITDSLKYFLAMMAAISLLVGGIGIMNIMLISVTERTREIGLRKAIGANNKDILSQFLFESITMTLIGGILGIIIGAIISFLISIIINYMNYDWEFVVSLPSIFAGIFVSAFVGIMFGIYPAKKASKLDPVQALKYE